MLAVIGGSRAYDLLKQNSFGDSEETVTPETPFGKSSPIHLFHGDGFSYHFISRHGEKGYEVTAPYVNYRANIWALKKLGVTRIISWSQPGSINRSFKPGDFCIPHDFIDMTKNRESTFYKNSGLGFIRMGEPFCPEIREALLSSEPDKIKFNNNSIYCCTEGPRLETPAEIKMFGSWGADLVGMTLIPESLLARELEICYGSICLVSNFAESVVKREFKEGELFEGMLSKEESAEVENSVSLLPEIAGKALTKLHNKRRECNCGKAMERYKKSGRIGDDLLEEIKKLPR